MVFFMSPARAQRRRHDRGRELAVRLHPGGAAQLVGRARQDRGLRARRPRRRRRAPTRSTSSTSAPGATARATPGPEALGQEGPQALMRLPWLMEEILDWWDKTKARPQFKAEYIITHNIAASLEAAARAVAARLKMSDADTETLVQALSRLPYPADRAGRQAGAAGAVLHHQGQPRPLARRSTARSCCRCSRRSIRRRRCG